MEFRSFRRERITRPLFAWARRALPAMSDTEREALEAGDVWWDAELFTGSPDWRKLLATPPARLTAAEQTFLDGPVEELCRQLDDWRINWEWRDLPPEIWDYLKRQRFFGMIIPEAYGGLGFSAFAHSEVVRKISTRSLACAVTVMVPNSLGPGELLLQFGTDAQKRAWLPRLADGREIPCFGLTSPEAGSDAASMSDHGVVAWGELDGERTLGIRLNWHKRYITLGPVATVLGLAFKLYDPDRLLGEAEELGITVALIPTDTPGVSIGRRHLPSFQPFQNGPNWGKDVFAPMDWVIGGQQRIGQGWKMLMSALAAGRGISLPSLSAAGAAFSAHTTGAYARVRQQFGIPIGRFEGVQHRLARIAGTAYLLDAARRLTCAGLDEGRKLAVISAIVKAHATNRMRDAINDAMDVHAGKAIIDGPRNYLGNFYRAVPVGITVEGANILTRNLIIFGQGAIRCHPYLLKEMLALRETDEEAAIARFDEAFWGHVGHSLANAGRTVLRNWSGGLISPRPRNAGRLARHYRQLSRYAAAFALLADLALLSLGGALKRKELLSARLGDILSELYLLSAVLKHFEDDGRPAADLPLVDYCMATGIATMQQRIAEVTDNLPSRPIAWLGKLLAQPLGPTLRGVGDRLDLKCADLLLEPSATRDRLTLNVFRGADGDALAMLDEAFRLVVEVDPLRRKLREAEIPDLDEAVAKGLIDAAQAASLRAADQAVARVIEVDDFAPEELSPLARRNAP